MFKRELSLLESIGSLLSTYYFGSLIIHVNTLVKFYLNLNQTNLIFIHMKYK